MSSQVLNPRVEDFPTRTRSSAKWHLLPEPRRWRHSHVSTLFFRLCSLPHMFFPAPPPLLSVHHLLLLYPSFFLCLLFFSCVPNVSLLVSSALLSFAIDRCFFVLIYDGLLTRRCIGALIVSREVNNSTQAAMSSILQLPLASPSLAAPPSRPKLRVVQGAAFALLHGRPRINIGGKAEPLRIYSPNVITKELRARRCSGAVCYALPLHAQTLQWVSAVSAAGTAAGAIVSLAIAAFLAFQHFSKMSDIMRAFDQASIVATAAIVAMTLVTLLFLI